MLKRKTDYRLEELAQALYELAEQSYPNGSPWQVGQFLADLQNEWSQYLIFTLEDDRLAGFVGFHQLFDEIEIMHIVVAPDRKGQGIGQQLLIGLLEEGQRTEVVAVFLEVRQSNQAAKRLYEKNGFVTIHRRKDYYHHPVEDALIMRKELREIKTN